MRRMLPAPVFTLPTSVGKPIFEQAKEMLLQRGLPSRPAASEGPTGTDSAALAERKDAWEHAYETTPHGKPVELRR